MRENTSLLLLAPDTVWIVALNPDEKKSKVCGYRHESDSHL